MTETKPDTVGTRLEICKNCEFNVYDVEPNFNICTKSEKIAISVVVEKDSCPIGKW